MRLQWKHIRAVSLGLGAFVAAVAVTAPVGNFFIALAAQHHIYDNPDKTVTDALAWLHGVTTTWWFQWSGGIIVGFALGAWLDALIGRRERNIRPQDKQGLLHLEPPERPGSEAPPDSITWHGGTPPEFGPPHPKDVVLVLEEPRVELTNAPNNIPALIESFVVIRNASAVTLSECRIRLTRYRAGGHGGPIEAQIDPGGPKSNDYFTLKSGERRRVRISRRDLADVVNEPPHRVALEGGKFIEFGDDEQCFLSLRLTSNAKRVTSATLGITTVAPEQVAINIVEQHLEEA
jgi:hypothetical protein